METKKNQVLLIEDDKVDQMAFRRFIKEKDIPYDLTIAGSVAEAKSILGSNKFDIVISDHFLGDGTAFEIFELDLDVPIVLMTGSGNQEVAVKAMKSGAYDYLIKDSKNNHLKVLPSTVENALSRKKIEEELQLIQFSVNNSSELIFWISPTGQLLFANSATCQILGYNIEELYSMNWAEIVPNMSVDKTHELIKNLKTEGSIRLEQNHRRKDGTIFPADIMANHKIINNKEYIFIFARDITERKRMEEAIKRHTEHLEEEVKERTNELIQTEKMASLGQLVAGVAHEINNPLAYLKTNTEFLEEDLLDLKINSGEKSQDIFGEMKELIESNIDGINRIAAITKALKRFARPGQEGRVVSDINQGLRDTLIIVHNHLKHRIKVHDEFGDIPKIVCNIGQINQVFMNLIMNASQAMDEGDIWIKTWNDKNNVYIRIRDNGKGIPEKDLNRIFDPFFTTKAEGTGLGLSLSYRLIQTHNGNIKVESEVGKGTTMIIKLQNEG